MLLVLLTQRTRTFFESNNHDNPSRSPQGANFLDTLRSNILQTACGTELEPQEKGVWPKTSRLRLLTTFGDPSPDSSFQTVEKISRQQRVCSNVSVSTHCSRTKKQHKRVGGNRKTPAKMSPEMALLFTASYAKNCPHTKATFSDENQAPLGTADAWRPRASHPRFHPQA